MKAKSYVKIRTNVQSLQSQIEDYVERHKWRKALNIVKQLLTKYGISYYTEDIVSSCDLTAAEITTMVHSTDGADVYCAAIAYETYPEYRKTDTFVVVGLFERAASLGIPRALLDIVYYVNDLDEAMVPLLQPATTFPLYLEAAEKHCFDAYPLAGQISLPGMVAVEGIEQSNYKAAWYYREAYLCGYAADIQLEALFTDHTEECIPLYSPGLLPFRWLPQDYRDRLIAALVVLGRFKMGRYLRMIICDYVCT